MTKLELVEKFKKNPAYLQNGAGGIAKWTKSSILDVLAAKEEVRIILNLPRKIKTKDSYQLKLDSLKLF